MWILTIRSPFTPPIRYELQRGTTSLGRSLDNNIVITDESSADFHAEIVCQNDQAIISDLGGINGTFINRKRIYKQYPLQPSDQIRIGQCILTVTYKEDGITRGQLIPPPDFLPLTRDLLLETIDKHAIIVDLFASRLTMILDLESALREIADLTRLTLGADKARVVPANQFNQIEEFEIPRNIFQKSIDFKALCITSDFSEQARKTNPGSDAVPIGSILCVPVLIENKVVSLIYAQRNTPNSLPFDEIDLQLAIVLSHQTGLTLQRAKLLEESQKFREQAITDSLTGINNRRQILHLLDIEFHRAQRFRHPLTIIIFDLDGLKQINDKYGHLVGDQALQLVAELCRCQLREIDSIGRFGGDEFIILLVETNLRDAHAVLKRIRESISARVIDTPLGPLTITISIGVASLDDRCPSSTSLLNLADNALLDAKKHGKDKVLIKY